MKKVSRHRCNSCNNGFKCRKGVHNGVHNGGVRYIKKILEKIVSRLNLQDLENPVRKQKARFKKSRTQNMNNILIVDDKIVNEIINSSF